MTQLWVVPDELDGVAASPYDYEACKAASYILWAFSGRKFNGIRQVTERYECPCRTPLVGYDKAGANWAAFTGTSPLSLIYPVMDGSGNVISSFGGCDCPGTVGGRHIRLRLRGNPIRSVQEVKSASGVVLDSNNYRVVNGSFLELINDGLKTEICGLEVTYTYGVMVPAAGKRAAKILATEFIKSWSGQDCDLPDRVTQVARQGVTFTVMDPQNFLDDGRIGIYGIDLFLRAANPDKARKPARVFSPDVPKAWRTTAGKISQVMGPFDWQITPGTSATYTLNLAQAGITMLPSVNWSPQAQISAWNGATTLEFDSSRFTFDSSGNLVVTLTSQETSALSGSKCLWDIYAVSTVDGFTLTHVLSSTIFLG